MPGPLATLMLRDLGAEVIKVEEPSGDPARYFPPMIGDTSAIFHYLNRGKRLVTLDLKEERGRERLHFLLEKADCLVEGFRPDVLPRLGFDPEELIARYKGLVIARLSGYGLHGPWRNRPGHDLHYLALSGVLEHQKTPLPSQFADIGAALLLAATIVSALLCRERGHDFGRVLDVPILDAAILFASPMHARQVAGDDLRPGVGVLEGGFPLYRIVEGPDGRRYAIGALEPRSINSIEQAFGTTNPDAIASRLGTVTESGGFGTLPESIEPVLSLEEARLHEAVKSRGIFHPMRTEAGVFMLPVTPFATPEDIPEGPWAGPPGKDNQIVFSDS